MKPYLLMKGWKAFALISLTAMLSACDGSEEMPGERKKMPRYNGSSLPQDGEYSGTKNYSSCGMGMEDYLVYMNGNKNTNQYFCIPLSDEIADEAALNLLDKFRPFISIYLAKQWSRSEYKGIMIDLRSNRSKMGSKEEYSLEKQNAFAIPLLILWDASSALRAKNFKVQLDQLPGLSYKKITEENVNF